MIGFGCVPNEKINVLLKVCESWAFSEKKQQKCYYKQHLRGNKKKIWWIVRIYHLFGMFYEKVSLL